MKNPKLDAASKIFTELALQLKDEEKFRTEIKDEFNEVLNQLKEKKPENKAEHMLQFETLLVGMTQSLKNFRDYNDKQIIILEDFKKLLEGNNIQ